LWLRHKKNTMLGSLSRKFTWPKRTDYGKYQS
jgi:hypothetical protein